MHKVLRTTDCLIILFLGLIAFFGSMQCLANGSNVYICLPQKNPPPPNIMYIASSDGELSPGTQLIASAGVTRQTIYGRDGAKVGFEISTHSQSRVDSLTLTIPPAGLGTGTFRVKAHFKKFCSLYLPEPQSRFVPSVHPQLALSAGGVYPVTAVGIDRDGVTSSIEATYKVLDAQLHASPQNPYLLSWSSSNAARLALFVMVPGATVTRIPGGLAAFGTTAVGPGTYMLVVVSPNSIQIPTPSAGTCGSTDTADAICRKYVAPAGTPPVSEGLVETNFKFFFTPSPTPCDTSKTGVVVVQGDSPQGNNLPASTFVAVVAGNYECVRSTLGDISQNSVISVPPGIYHLSAQSDIGGSAVCQRDISESHQDVTFNGNGDRTLDPIPPQGSCE